MSTLRFAFVAAFCIALLGCFCIDDPIIGGAAAMVCCGIIGSIIGTTDHSKR